MPRLRSIKYIIAYRTGRIIDTSIIQRVLLRHFGASFDVMSLDMDSEVHVVLEQVGC